MKTNLKRRSTLRLLVAVASLCVLAGPQAWSAATSGGEGEWIPLFNGRNLEGWTPKIRGYPLGENYANTFRVEDGLLKVRYDGYEKFAEKFGHIFYRAPFTNYIVRVEYRFVGNQLPDGPGWALRNSGIMVHCQAPETMAKDQDFPACLEVQLLGGASTGERHTANLCSPGTHVVMNGKLITQHCVESTSKTYRGDQWVTVEVEVRGSKLIRHIVEGQTVLSYSEPQLDEGDASANRLLRAGAPKIIDHGYISLQSESHPIEFRKVELRQLAN